MLSAWTLLIVSLVIILVGCDLFTNSIEWAGKRLKLGAGAVGSILAAVGTCLPETLIAMLAIFFGGKDIGVGAILGAPLMLATLAFFVTGIAVLVYSSRRLRTRTMSVDHKIMARDLRYFFIVFSLSALASFLPQGAPVYATAAALIFLYALYVKQTFADNRHTEDSEEELSPLHFYRKGDPQLGIILTQTIFGLLVLVGGAHLFVDELSYLSQAMGVAPIVLSLIITPVATELPEKFNSILWVRRKKDTLALGNITGAMVFQSSVPTAVGMLFTDWRLSGQALAAVVVAVLSAMVVWTDITTRRRLSAYSLLVGGIFYGVYLFWVFRLYGK